MKVLRLLLLIILFVNVIDRDFIFHVNGRGLSQPHIYNHSLALILVEYASAVFVDDTAALLAWNCSRCHGLTEGFKVIEVVRDTQHCLQGFVGYAQDLEAIVIAFRGTQKSSLQNWIADLYFKQLDFDYPGVTGAKVHHGFYTAYYNTSLRQVILPAIKSILAQRNNMRIIVTGHSLGGALASLCAIDLVANNGAQNVEVMTFGQPRIGNPKFAKYYSSFIPKTIRLTHDHDIVPHLPPYYPYFGEWTYHHFATEVWLYSYAVGLLNYEVFRVCNPSGEDLTCCRSVAGDSIADHLMYLGVFMNSDPPESPQAIQQINNDTSAELYLM